MSARDRELVGYAHDRGPHPNEALADPDRGRLDPRMGSAFVIFFIEAFAFASWLPRLPELKATFGLSEGELGLVLLGLPVGALVVMPLAGWATTRLSIRRLNLVGMVWMYAAIAAIGLAPSPQGLAAVLFAVGLGTGTMGVAMNAAGFAAEQALGRPILSRCHGFFSLGLAAGGLAAGLFLWAEVPIAAHLASVCAVLLFVLLAALRHVSDKRPRPASDDEHMGRREPRFALPTRALLVPALIACACLFAEGAALDWSSVFLEGTLNASGTLVGGGVAAFAAAMALARFAGDALSARFGERTLVRVGGLLAASGYVAVALAPNAWVALGGFVVLGLGLAPVVPIAFRIAARLSPAAPGLGVAAVSTLGYAGFLASPALVGLVADAASLRWSFMLVAIVLVGVSTLANRRLVQ